MPATKAKAGISHVAFVTVNVTDVDAAIAFYADQLGFTKTTDATMGDMRWVELTPPGNTTRLTLISPGNPAYEPDRIGKAIGATFEVNDMPATAEALKARGVRFGAEPRLEPWGWWAEILDPDGNTLGLHAEA
jgi:predicted enzyme related to lactoylglutathione lyase